MTDEVFSQDVRESVQARVFHTHYLLIMHIRETSLSNKQIIRSSLTQYQPLNRKNISMIGKAKII